MDSINEYKVTSESTNVTSEEKKKNIKQGKSGITWCEFYIL